MSKKDSLIFSKLLALFLWTSLFTVLIFQVQVWLYGEENVVRVEDEYIEPTISDPSIGVFGTGISDEEYSDTLGVIESAKEAEYSSASELIFDFFPEHFQYSVAPETGLVRSIL
ncbi:MAG: hypothetical protein H6767_06975 [Candidatus Peribacteria bacterium]|nr:MAG: hypothetical protein H6767_06975 [Candidatus Peribacteria bacterium]